MTNTPDICVLPHHHDPERPRPALDGLYLCHGHHTELQRLITQLPNHHDDLDRALTANGPKISHSNSPGLNIDETAAELRTQIQHDLLWWCIYVADQRGIHRPTTAEPHTTATWLTRHVDWCAADRPAAEELLPVLRELTGRAIGITDLRARRIHLGEQCLTHTDGDRCTGEITIVIRGDDWVARCPECRIDQDATPYLRIAQRGQWITTDDVIRLAGLFGIPCSHDVVRQWKHRRHITGIIGAVENLYDLASVQSYLARRQTERERIGA